jgi:hypothetical protein
MRARAGDHRLLPEKTGRIRRLIPTMRTSETRSTSRTALANPRPRPEGSFVVAELRAKRGRFAFGQPEPVATGGDRGRIGGDRAFRDQRRRRAGTTTTGTRDRWRTSCTVLPRRNEVPRPRPRVPMKSRS